MTYDRERHLTRRRAKNKQGKINQKLKKRIFSVISIAPCYYCKKVFISDDLTIEHITPLSMGGTNDSANITLACEPCNKERGRLSWFEKKKMLKEQYGKYTSEHCQQDRQKFVSAGESSDSNNQRNGFQIF